MNRPGIDSSTAAGQPAAVELTAITKRFPGVVANRDVNLRVHPGTVHAVVGENGAGKSTLMKTLYGMHRPDEGTIAVAGQPVQLRSPADAISHGIGMVHQHFQLADNLTVLENVVLGAEPRRGLRLDRAAARARITQLGERYGLVLDPDALVDDLGVGDRQRVEIIKVLYRGARILVLDEPTAVLVPHEVQRLFSALAELKAQGLTLIFISHKLDEVLQIADRITVMRRGTTVADLAPADVDARGLAELMVGSQLPLPPPRGSRTPGAEVLRLDGIGLSATPEAGSDARALLADVHLQVHAGEIVGMAGVEGNGQAELVEVVMGLRRAGRGRVLLGGEDVTAWSTRRRREAGMAFVPEDRQRHGLLVQSTLWENRILGHQTRPPVVRGPLIDRAGARRDTLRIVQTYDVRTPSIDVLAGALSGGNQQKLIVGREMADQPRLLIAAHPTRGVDVGAQSTIWGLIRRARDEGLAVLLISADLDELIGLSDRLQVILRGRLVGELDPATVSAQDLGAAMTGAA